MIHATTAYQTLTRLTRLAQRRPECGRWLTESLRGRPELAQTALDVAVESGDPIGKRLASLLASGGHPEHIEAVAELCASRPYVDSLYLREAALAATARMVEDRCAADPQDEPSHADLALWLERHGRLLSRLERRSEALRETQRAVDLRRQLARDRPWRHRPNLGRSLNNLGLMLRDLNLHKQALNAFQEEINLYRELLDDQPEANLPLLAVAYANLSLTLRDLGRPDEALLAIRLATDLERKLGGSGAGAFRVELASNLNNLATMLRESGRLKEALEAVRESVALYRELAAARFDLTGPEPSAPSEFSPPCDNGESKPSAHSSARRRPLPTPATSASASSSSLMRRARR